MRRVLACFLVNEVLFTLDVHILME
jgi:hypothetical protein